MIRPLITAAAALTIAAMPAFAASVEPFEMSVDIDRAALATADGAQKEFASLKEEVHTRCVAEAKEWTLSSNYAVSFCETRTLKSAITTIDNANLTAAYEASIAR